MALPTIFVSPGQTLPPQGQWENRFEIRSESSNRIYIVAQHKVHRHWGCSCPGWRSHRNCKHLGALGLPSGERPYEVHISAGAR